MTANRLKIGLIQLRCEKLAVEANLAEVARSIAEAADRGVEIIGFPEMTVAGYADPIKQPAAIMRLDGPEVDRCLRFTTGRSITALIGLIEENPAGKPFITHFAARAGQLLGHYRKHTIIDDEALWFSRGETIPVFKHNDLTFGIAICADIHTDAVFAECARQGARIVFELAAPGLYGEQATRDWRAGFEWWRGECRTYLGHYAEKYHLWIAVATQAGHTTDEDFPGGGYVFAPDGRCVYATPDGTPGAVYVELDLDELTCRDC